MVPRLGPDQPPPWAEAIRLPGARLGDLDRVWSTFPAPLPSAEGYRIIWVHSTAKAARDAAARAAASRPGRRDRRAGHPTGRTQVPGSGPAPPSSRPSPRRWPTPVRPAGCSVTISETIERGLPAGKRGRPGADTRYRRTTRTRHTVSWRSRDDAIAYDAAGDGCFPLITNDRQLTEKDVLAAYRYQPNLERRHHLLKSVQDADPIWLRDPARIEAIFCCQFLVLLVGALIERRSAPP